MNPIQKGRLHVEIREAVVKLLDDNEEIVLNVRNDSACHFFPRFVVDEDEIQLRLDWSHIDENGYPTVDADFYSTKSGRKRALVGARRESHHTNTVSGQGRQYNWAFKGCKKPFEVRVTWLGQAETKISMFMQFDATVIKADQS